LSSTSNPLAPQEPLPALEPTPPARELSEDPPFNAWDVALLAFIFFLAVNVFLATAIFAAVAMHWDGLTLEQLQQHRQEVVMRLTSDVRLLLPVQVLGYLVGLGFMLAIVRMRYQRDFLSSVRWNWPGARWSFYAALGGLMAVAAMLLSIFLPMPKSVPFEKLFQNAQAAYLLAALGIFLAPVMEELFFRGFLYPVLARGLGAAAGVIITGFAFMVVHGPDRGYEWAPLLVLFLVGVMLTAVRAKTKSVAASTLVHMGYNGIIFVITYVATDHFRHLERLNR
jgi:membrane protease YdiL (CAAX protease family)